MGRIKLDEMEIWQVEMAGRVDLHVSRIKQVDAKHHFVKCCQC